MVGNSDDETNFPRKLLLTNRQIKNLHKAFANKSSANIKLSKTLLSNMLQSGGFLGRLLVPLLKTGLPLMKNVIKPLAKSVLIPLGLTAAASAADAGIHTKILGSGHQNTRTLIISNDEMGDSGLLLKWVEVNLILTFSANCVIIYTNVANQIPTFTIAETKLYVPVITLSAQDNAKSLQQLKSGF